MNCFTLFYFTVLSGYRVLIEDPPVQYSRRVEDQAVPLALDVVVLRLLCDVHSVKLQLPGQLLLPLEDHQGDLRRRHAHQDVTHKGRGHMKSAGW